MNHELNQLPLQQSKEWQRLQQDLGEKTFFCQTKNYQFLAIKKSTPLGHYLYLPYGPFINPSASQANIKNCFSRLLKIAAQENAFFIRLEPQNFSSKNSNPQSQPLTISQKKSNVAQYFSLNSQRLRKTKDLNPAETWCLDLTQPESDILTHFSQGTRTRHNTYRKKGLTVEISHNPTDIKYLVNLQHKLAKEKHIASFSEDYLKTELSQPFASLFLVKFHHPGVPSQLPPQNTEIPTDSSPEITNINSTSNTTSAKNAPVAPSKNTKPTPQDGEVIAASLFFDFKDTRFYMQSAANLDFRYLPATVALLSHAIFDAKAKGLKTLDFWGIAPEGADASHPWYGFTEFKKSFGGYEKIYAGTFDYLLDQKHYRLYSLLRKLNRFKRHLFS